MNVKVMVQFLYQS